MWIIVDKLFLLNQVFLEVNLGPIHLLDPLIKQVFERYKREFLFKRTNTGAFATHHLKEYQLGAALRNRREKEEDKSRFPLSFWN